MAMVNDRFAQLIARKFSGEASQDELRELEILLKEDERSQYFFEVFSEYWNAQPQPVDNTINEEVHFQQILAIAEKEQAEAPLPEPVKRNSTVFPIRKLLAAAAILGIIASAYLLSRFSNVAANTNQDISLKETITAKPGTKIHLLLPDGSKVWLNSESKLEYNKNFKDSIREVVLEGEGFFEVVKDKNRPFVVRTSDIDIKVLGTAFNVKSYPKESYIETTLLRGLVEVTNKRDPASPKMVLYPHDKLIFNKDAPGSNTLPQTPRAEMALPKPFEKTRLSKTIADSSLVETSWMYNKLLFDGETLRQNASKLERWYNVKILFKEDKVGNTLIRYPLSNEPLEEALKALQFIEPFNYKINGNEIEIWRERNVN